MKMKAGKGPWRRYADFYSGSRRWVAFAIVLGVAELAMVIPVPMLIRSLFDEDIRNGHVQEIALSATSAVNKKNALEETRGAFSAVKNHGGGKPVCACG